MVTAGFTGGQAEDLRRALGFKRSEKRMKDVEITLRAGMAKNGITGDVAEQIISSITAFALYGFPESHAASFALLAYASAYLKVHFPAAFYTALLNNQPMGFYHPATLVKDAQRRGVRFTASTCSNPTGCAGDEDGSIRLGLRYVSGLRQRSASPRKGKGQRAEGTKICPKCGVTTDDDRDRESRRVFLQHWLARPGHSPRPPRNPQFQWRTPPRFTSVDYLVTRTGIRAKSCRRLPTLAPSHHSL